jgi:hypothetical protein
MTLYHLVESYVAMVTATKVLYVKTPNRGQKISVVKFLH